MRKSRKITFLILTLFFLLVSIQSFAQSSLLIKGKVIDAETKELLPFASIGIEGTSIGTASNSEGYFEFKVSSNWKERNIVCSFVGYKTFKIRISEADTYSKAGQLVFEMQPAESLKAVTISSKRIPKVEKIMKQVIKNLSTNYPQKPYNADFFYREYLKDSTAYVRLVEAALNVYDKRSYVPIIYNYKNKATGMIEIKNIEEEYFVQVRERRASYDYSKSRKNNFYIDVEYGTKYNWLRKQQFIFDKEMYEKFDYELINLTSLGGKTVYEIAFSYNGTIDRFRKLKGKVFVNEEDYAVLQLHFSYLPVGTMGGYNSEERYGYNIYLENEEHFYFKKYGEEENAKYLVSYQSLRSTEKYYESSEAFEESVSEYFVEQLTVDVNLENPTPQELQDASKLKEVKYNPLFWESYNVLADSPLNLKIKEDLEKRQSLEKQFEIGK